MKVRLSGYRVFLLLGLGAVLFFLLFFHVDGQARPMSNGNVFALEGPPFVGIANAEPLDVSSYLDDEAGISAWFQSPDVIVLDDVRDEFRTIEVETEDYIIGSVPVPDYGEAWDVHVYVHVDGWILSYYLQEDPAGKIPDWRSATGQNLDTTVLENVVGVIASAAAVPFSSATYYDFRYPNATHMMMVAESSTHLIGTDEFEINIPSSYAYYERSWSIWGSRVARYYLDGVRISGGPGYGTFSASELSPDVFHTVGIQACYADAHGGLVLIYRVP